MFMLYHNSYLLVSCLVKYNIYPVCFNILKVSGVHSNALDALLAIKKLYDKSLPSVVAQVNSLLQDLKTLHPEGYSMDNLNDDLSTMTIIHALDLEHNKIAFSLVCFDFTCSEVVQTFICKYNYCLPYVGGAENAANSAYVSPLPSSSQDAVCNICDFKGHLKATLLFVQLGHFLLVGILQWHSDSNFLVC
jgi:hypothetical protein